MYLGHLIRDSNKEPLKVSCTLEVSPVSGPPALSLSSVDESEGDLGPPACRVLESSQYNPQTCIDHLLSAWTREKQGNAFFPKRKQ